MNDLQVGTLHASVHNHDSFLETYDQDRTVFDFTHAEPSHWIYLKLIVAFEACWLCWLELKH